MNQSYEFELYVFGGDCGLPSIHFDSLLTIVYCSLNNVKNLNLKYSNDIMNLPKLLSVNHGEWIDGCDNIIQYFEQNYVNKKKQPQQQQQEQNNEQINFQSFKCLFENRLKPTLLYLYWYDENNYNENTSKLYSKQLSFPMNFLLPRQLRKKSVEELERSLPVKVLEDDNRTKLIEKLIFSNCIECLNSISKRLDSDNKYLFGSNVTKIDAYLYTYLSLLSQLPCKKKLIHAHIQQSIQLQNYMNHIQDQNELLKKLSKEASTKNSSRNNDDDSYSSLKWSDLIFSGAVASLLMIYYAFSIGLIGNKQNNDDYDDQQQEEQEIEIEHQQQQKQSSQQDE